MKEVSKEYIQKQKIGFVFWIYHPLTKQLKREVLSKDSIVYSKYCYEVLGIHNQTTIFDFIGDD